MRTTDRRRRLLLLILPAAGLVWWGWRGPEPPPPAAPSAAAGKIDLASWQGAQRAVPHQARTAAEPAARKTGRPIDLYLAQSRYPPASRPLDRQRNPDLIDWNIRWDDPRVTQGNRTVDYLYSGNVLWVIGERPITTFLRVRRDGVPTDVKITQAFVTVEVQSGEPLPPEARESIPLAYTLVEGQYLATFRPADLPWIKRVVDLVFHIEFDYGGGSLERAVLAAGYTPTAAAPARFTGQYREAIEKGSLVIYAGVEVLKGGWYNLDCNLWDAANQPVAWTRFKGELQPGMREARLMFFGKVLTDSGSTSPWHLGELRGFRYEANASPSEELMDPPSASFTTRRYSLSELSPAEWDAPERDRMLQALLADESTGQAPPIPAESFENDVR